MLNWKKNEKPVCAKTNQFSLCNSTQNAEDYNESPSDEGIELHLTVWGKSMNVSEIEFLTVPVRMLAHVQTEAEKELFSFYIFQLHLL